MRKNKLYKVNKYNRPYFGLGNIFDIGGGVSLGNTNLMQYGKSYTGLLGSSTTPSQFFGTNTSLSKPAFNNNINWGTASGRAQGLGQSKALVNSFSSEASQKNALNQLGNLGSKGSEGGSGGAGGGSVGAAVGGALAQAGSTPFEVDGRYYKRGVYDALDPFRHAGDVTFSDGNKGHIENGVGEAFSDAGVGVFQAGASMGNGYVMLAGAALKTIGDIVNNAFGIAVNDKRLGIVNEGIKKNTSFISDAKTLDDVKGPEAVETNTDVYRGGLFTKGKARRKNEELKGRMIDARQFAGRSVENNIDNLIDDQYNQSLANYAAYGGLLTPYGQFGGGSLGIMQNDKYLDTIENRTKALAQKNNTMNAGLSMKAFGGELGTNGTDFTNGLMYIDEGGSHESNPFDGVPMGFDAEGIPNLVEEGETVYNNYVFSDRMHVPDFMLKDLGLPKSKKQISFADASKKLAKESEQRPNDPLSQAGLNASLSRLAEVQEAERAKQSAKEYMEGGLLSCGGGLKHKFDKGGVKPYAYSKNWDGFKYFDPKTGEYDKGYLDFVNNINQDWLDRIFSESQPYGSMDRYLAKNKGYALTPKQASALAQDKMYSDMHKAMAAAYDDYKAGMDPKTGKVADNSVWLDESWEHNPYDQEGWEEKRGLTAVKPEDNAVDVGDMTGEKEFNPDDIKDPEKYATWMRYVPAIGAGVMTLTDALGLTNKPDYSGLAGLEAAAEAAGYVPEVKAEPISDYMRYTPLDRMFHTNQLLASSRATDRALLNSSSPSKAAALLANGYNTNLALGNLARQAEEYNRGIYERTKEFNRKTNMFNSQMGLEAAMANARYRQQGLSTKLSGLAQAAALRDSIDSRVGAARSANITNLLDNLGAIGRENFVFNQINSDRSRQYGVDRSGESSYKRNSKKSR